MCGSCITETNPTPESWSSSAVQLQTIIAACISSLWSHFELNVSATGNRIYRTRCISHPRAVNSWWSFGVVFFFFFNGRSRLTHCEIEVEASAAFVCWRRLKHISFSCTNVPGFVSLVVLGDGCLQEAEIVCTHQRRCCQQEIGGRSPAEKNDQHRPEESQSGCVRKPKTDRRSCGCSATAAEGNCVQNPHGHGARGGAGYSRAGNDVITECDAGY